MPRRVCLGLIVLFAACKGSPDPTPYCADTVGGGATPAGVVGVAPEAPTYHRDVRPIVDSVCGVCHVPDGMAAFLRLDSREAIADYAELVRSAVVTRHMPPWQAARCCQEYQRDFSLTAAEVETLTRWIDQGLPEGNPMEAPPPRPPLVGLSRVDLTLTMAEPYQPRPPAGHTDEQRCFLIDWPLTEPMYITGLNPVPGNRAVVHHLIVTTVSSEDRPLVAELDAADDRPGFDCSGGLAGLRSAELLGGSLLGSDFPAGIGTLVEPGRTIVLQLHYTTAAQDGADQTSVQFKLDAQARPATAMFIANPAWFVDRGMRIEAGDPDAVFWYQFDPWLFTGHKRKQIWGLTPHMHYFGKRLVLRIVRQDGERVCLLEVPAWHFGWEQTFWLQKPVILEPGDELYVECRFDNSAENQPGGQAPREIGWGDENQDMCAAFLSFTEVP